MWASGIGETGYIQDSPLGEHVGPRIQSDVIAHHPDIVVFCYGSNDLNYPAAQVASVAAQDWATVKAGRLAAAFGRLPRHRLLRAGRPPRRGR